VCGIATTEKILTVFGGMNLRIPSHEDVNKMKRDLNIYNALVEFRDDSFKFKIVRRTVQARYGMKKKKVLAIFDNLEKLHKRGAEIKAVDKSVAAHKKVVRKTRKRRLK
jgi:hypothetical protein